MTQNPVPYSPALKAGEFLFVSGQLGLDGGELVDGGFVAQAKQGLANLAKVLADNGADVTNLVKTTIFLADMGDYATMNQIYGEFVGDHWPARSCVEVSALPRGAVFEIEAIAYVG